MSFLRKLNGSAPDPHFLFGRSFGFSMKVVEYRMSQLWRVANTGRYPAFADLNSRAGYEVQL